jgi:hypothetical protein
LQLKCAATEVKRRRNGGARPCSHSQTHFRENAVDTQPLTPRLALTGLAALAAVCFVALAFVGPAAA